MLNEQAFRHISDYANAEIQIKIASLMTRYFYLAERTGLEPATPCVTGRYSNQLNYHSIKLNVQTILNKYVF